MINAQEAKKLTIEVNKQNEGELKDQIEDFEWHIAKTIEKGFSAVYITYNGHVRCIKFLEEHGYKTKLIKKTEKTETWLVSWGDYTMEKRDNVKIPYNGVILNGKVYTNLIAVYNDGYNTAMKDFRNIDDKYKEGFNDGYKKGRQECTNSFNAGYDVGYRTGKEI